MNKIKKIAKHSKTYLKLCNQGPEGDKKEEITKITACYLELKQ
ncbi:14085_t:CDS:1, partial [Cetraspora pellucida]